MTISSASAACAMPADGLDTVGDAEDAMIQVADKYSRGLGVRASPPAGRRAPRQPEPAAMQRPAGRGLPEEYLPLSEVTDLALLGRWPLLDDRMSPACRRGSSPPCSAGTLLGDQRGRRLVEDACPGVRGRPGRAARVRPGMRERLATARRPTCSARSSGTTAPGYRATSKRAGTPSA